MSARNRQWFTVIRGHVFGVSSFLQEAIAKEKADNAWAAAERGYVWKRCGRGPGEVHYEITRRGRDYSLIVSFVQGTERLRRWAP